MLHILGQNYNFLSNILDNNIFFLATHEKSFSLFMTLRNPQELYNKRKEF